MIRALDQHAPATDFMEPLPNRFILIVEDHVSTAAVMARLVQARGFRVLTALSLAEARCLARENDIGFVISDLGLSDGDGCALMSELHEQSGLRGAAVSGFGLATDLERSRRAGFVLHLVKPIQVADLEHLLEVAREELAMPVPPFPGIH